MITGTQRDAFTQALKQARRTVGLSQRALGKAAGMTHSVIWQYESGNAAPKPATVERLERALGLEAGDLGRLLGYLDDAGSDEHASTVVDAVNADTRLGEPEREFLVSVYRWLVRHRSTVG